jgi:hypothetical protein
VLGVIVSLAGCQSLLSNDSADRVIDAGPDSSDDAPTPPDASVAAKDADVGDSPRIEAAASAYADEVLADKPIAYFRLGDPIGSGSVLSSLGGVLGATSGGVMLGRPGALVSDPDTAADFDGTARITLPSGPFQFAQQQPFAIELWVRPSIAAGASEHLFSSEGYVDTARAGYNLHRYSNALRFERFSSVGQTIADLPDIPANEWSYVVARYDGATLALSVRGGASGDKEVGDPGAVAAYGSAALLGVSAANDAYFTGTLDEVAVYDHALPPERIERHFSVGVIGH